MPGFDVGEDLPGMQIQGGQDGQGAVTNVFVVTSELGLASWHGRKIGCGQANRLNARFFIEAPAIHRFLRCWRCTVFIASTEFASYSCSYA